jgi:predicted O-linked N-acetylglucosamine transferase (SPINDLY family)
LSKKNVGRGPASVNIQEAGAKALQLYGVGQLPAALVTIERALTGVAIYDAAHAELLNIAGVISMQLGNAAKADQYFRQAMVANLGFADAPSNLGYLHMRLGNFDEAEKACRRAVAINGRHPVALNNLGIILRRQDKFVEAEAAYRKVLSVQPDYTDAWSNFGNLLRDLGRYSEAGNSYQQALKVDSRHADALSGMGLLLIQSGRMLDAEGVLHQALTVRPKERSTLCEWIMVRRNLCDWGVLGAVEDGLAGLLSDPGATGGIPPFATLAMNAFLPLLQRKAAQMHAESQFGHLLRRERLSTHKPVNKSRLRIGYLSADFHAHATMQLFGGVLANHDGAQFEVFLYSFGKARDSDVSRFVQDNCARIRYLDELSDLDAAALIASDVVDLLIDLKGYTQGGRPGITALRPAPVVVSWLGYPGTLGHTGMADYIIGDSIVTPLEHAAHFSETIAQLPNCYQPNNSRNIIGCRPSRSAVGLPEVGFVFCNFNHVYKTTPERFALWCRLLEAVPGSVLWQLAPKDDVAVSNLKRELATRGIAPERLVLAPLVGFTEHLGRLQLADLALDTFPCTSHTTASDALWAGVPLVTRIGETFASRVAGSLLRALNLPELIVASEDDYFALALSLARSPAHLGELRARLSANRLTAPLFDTGRFTRDLEELYKRIWAQECSGVRAPLSA